MLVKYFKKGREYFLLRNYKYETVFHVAAKNNSLDAITELVGKSVFITQLLKKDYEGNTAIHVAAKSGSLEVLEWLIKLSTPSFLEIKNDFGFTPLEATREKLSLMEEVMNSKTNPTENEIESHKEKSRKLVNCINLLKDFNDFVDEERWSQTFEMSLDMFLDQVADANLRIFMGRPKPSDMNYKNMYHQ